MSSQVRLVGVSIPDVSDWREPLPAGKWSRFFAALSRQAPVVDIVTPRLSALERGVNAARAVAPGLAVWRARMGFNLLHVAFLDRAVERELRARAGSYDVIVQLQTLCSSRSASVTAPYVIYTDNTMALTRRHYPQWAPIGERAARDWERFEAQVCRQARRVFTFSEFARRSVIEDYNCDPQAVIAVGAGANQSADVPVQVDDGPPRAVFIGGDFARKGGHVLLEAWRWVRDELPEAELLLAGPRRDPRRGDEQGVSWLGHLGRERLADLYGSARLFVMPSLFEPWGFVFLEAMGYGLPCVASDACAMPEIVVDGVTGRLVEPGRAEPLAAALVELMRSPDTAREMGLAGHERMRSRFTWDHVAQRVVANL